MTRWPRRSSRRSRSSTRERYGGTATACATGSWLPARGFEPPDGDLWVGLLGGEPVTGGAFRRFDDTTAELKRIWTDSRHRRRGHGQARWFDGWRPRSPPGATNRIYLTTGDRQPEAEALYLSMGYTRLSEPLPAAGEVYPLAFLKAHWP